jgi:hypothetical protein
MNFSIEIHSDRRWSYALAGTRRPLVKRIVLSTDGSIPPRDFKVIARVSLEFPTPESPAEVWTGGVPRVLPRSGPQLGEPIEWDRIQLKLNNALLGRLQEKVRGVIRVDIVDVENDEVIVTATQDLELLAPNEFRQELDYMDLIAAFVLPTDPFVSEILRKARQILHDRTGDSSTEGYQSGEKRVHEIAHAVYDAMSQVGFDYSNPQGYFEAGAQRVRTPSQIKEENCATCLDSAVLMAACFAQAGLEPVIFLITGHAFAGYFTAKPVDIGGSVLGGDSAVNYWLKTFKANRRTQLLRSRDLGLIQELLQNRIIQPVETTTTTRGLCRSFSEACQRQNNFSVIPDPLQGTDDSTLNSIVVVQLAWQDGITPPVAFNRAAETTFESWDLRQIPDGSIENEILELDEATLSDAEKAIPPRVRQWMASLLDLSSKNPLLKIRPKQVLEFDVPGSIIGSLDDLLHKPKGRIRLPYFSELPVTWVHNGVTTEEFDEWSKGSASLVFPSYRDLNKIQSTVERKLAALKADPDFPPDGPSDAQLISYLRAEFLKDYDSSLTKAAKKQIDKANEIMLMTGNNSLYLALGVMSWTENSDFRGKVSSTDWNAPLYLYPVILDGGKGRPWSLILDPKSEITPNFCLHEKLKRPPYNIDLQELVNPEEDEHGINLDKMIRAIRQRLSTAKLDNFSVQSRAVLGAFNYANFRLWKDLRDDWKRMSEISPVFKHIAYTSNVPYESNPPVPEPQLEPLLPIAADDSQRDAVQLALDGQSFKLEGPPGTGKSQTITNLLASCIAHNKKVLFVAEKQTALNAVKERLDKTGLGTFTLNLHAKGDSDTKLRNNIATALNDAMKANIDPRDNAWNDIEFKLANERNALDRYRRSLHERGPDGFSTWDANEDLLEVGEGPEVELPLGFVARFAEMWPQVQSAALDLERALELVPNPAIHPWRFVGLVESAIDFAGLTSALRGLSTAADRFLTTIEGGEMQSALTEELLDVIELVAGMERNGLLPPSDLFVGSTDTTGALVEFLSRVSRALTEARSLSEKISPHAHALSPEFFVRSNHDELRLLLRQNDLDGLKVELGEIESDWLSIVRQAAALPDPQSQRPIQSDQIELVRQRVASVESTNDEADFNQLIQSFRSLATRVRDHEKNIAPEILERTDIADLEFRAKEASEAGALAHRRKVKALRELLGQLVRTTDYKLLVNSTSQMIGIVREFRDLVEKCRLRFPEVRVDGVKFWDSDELDRFAGELVKVRVSRLRELNLLKSPPDDDHVFMSAIRTLLAISPLVEGQLVKVRALLPNASAASFQPWVAGEFERFRTLVIEYRNREILSVVGADALDPDPLVVIRALNVFLDSSSRIADLQRSLRQDVFPNNRSDLRPWEKGDVDQLEDAASIVESLVEHATSVLGGDNASGNSVLRKVFVGASSSPAVSALFELAIAWSAFQSVLPIGSSTSLLRGRPIFEAIREDIPALIRDSGDHNSYIQFNRWQELQNSVATLNRLGMSASVPSLLARDFGPMELLTRVRRSALAQALRLRMQEGNLDAFDRKVHELRIAAFEKALGEERKILGQRIPGLAASRRQARRLPSGAPRGATQDLLKGLKPKRGDKTPIRDLITKFGSAMAEAMPCFLMSPDSVASLVPVGSIEFDLVVFDEASQIRTAHAMGALGRGKAGIVVGDSRQMPPSTTFSSNSGAFIVDDDGDGVDDVIDEDGSLDEYEEDGEEKLVPVAARDAESILTEFEDSRMPERQLLCHYRSKDEVLISFSNTFIYPEPMLTFPSTAGLQSTSLRFIHVPDGRFERDKGAKPHRFGEGVPPVPARGTNLREAELIVDDVLARLKDPKRRARRATDATRMAETIIVVTFNIPQMNLITEMLRHRDPKLMDMVMNPERPDEDTEFPPQLKVRNLENVQGDEAETVIFSVAFSKTPKGTMPINFGPVTKPGGERRLNVAVTRAQREMVVYASFLPEDMMHGRKAIGNEAKLVQQFLKLAQKGPGAAGDVGIAVPTSRHIEVVADKLRDLGFEVYTQLGLSSLRVDLALRRPGSERWEIAVMVDDTCWSERGSAFQREVLPRQVLPAMGWKRILRIWLPAWKNSKEEILDEFRELLVADLDEVGEDIEGDPVVEEEIASDSAPMSSVAATVAGPNVEVYLTYSGSGPGGQETMYALGADPKATAKVMELAMAVLDIEAPIEATRFGRTVCRAFDFGQAKTARIEQIIGLLPPGLVRSDVVGRFVWREESQWENWMRYRRSDAPASRVATEISYFEYRAAVIDFVELAHSMSVEDVVSELAAVFGIQRVSASIRSVFDSVISEILRVGDLILDEGLLRLPQ